MRPTPSSDGQGTSIAFGNKNP